MNSDIAGTRGCVPNISSRERKKRLLSGLLAFMFAIVILILLIVLGVDRWWRLLLFLPFWGAAIGFYQWRDKT